VPFTNIYVKKKKKMKKKKKKKMRNLPWMEKNIFRRFQMDEIEYICCDHFYRCKRSMEVAGWK